MTEDEAHAIIMRLTRRLKGVPESEVLQDYYARLERLNHAHGQRVAEHLLDHRTFWPSLAELRESVEATAKAEYASNGERLHKRPPWWLTPKGQRAIADNERLITMSDEDYEAYLDARRAGNTWTMARLLDETESTEGARADATPILGRA